MNNLADDSYVPRDAFDAQKAKAAGLDAVVTYQRNHIRALETALLALINLLEYHRDCGALTKVDLELSIDIQRATALLNRTASDRGVAK